MEYLIGGALALGVGLFATLAGPDRDRAFYPVVLIVIASSCDLFAMMGQGGALACRTTTFARLKGIGWSDLTWRKSQ